MNNTINFTNEDFGIVRTVKIENTPYFVGKDVAEILGYSNTRKALHKRVDEDDKGVTKCDSLGREQYSFQFVLVGTLLVSGLFALCLYSNQGYSRSGLIKRFPIPKS